MLSTQEISAMIHQPGKIGMDQIDELENLAAKHPYAQIFSILLLKGLANSKAVTFDEQLTKHSFKISNRVNLYNLIHQFEAKEEISTDEKEIIENIPEEKIVVAAEPIVETEQPIQEEKTAIEPVAETIKEDIESTEKEVDSTQDALEESILHSAFVTNFKLEELTPEEEIELDKRDEKKEVKNSQTTDNVEVEPNTSSTFITWLHADENFIAAPEIDKEAIDSVVNDFEGFDPLSELSGEVEKPKAAFFSPTQKGKESLSEETLPVSETLAKIYFLQGNYPKAIEAYQQLSLKFPEKKIFFANLIEDLKKKLNT